MRLLQYDLHVLAGPVRIAASDVVSQWRTFSGADTLELGVISRMGAWGMTEATAKFSNEISIVAKAAGVGDLADGLACFEKRPAFQQRRGVIQTNRLDEVAAGGVSRSKELLKVA